jgi:hypothetical protein
MSFDSTFDYSSQITRISSRITCYQELLATVDADINTFNSCVGFCGIKATKLEELNRLHTTYTNEITKNQSALDEITNINNLSSDDKNKLYTFMQYTGYTVGQYMAIITHNFAELLADADFLAISTDSTNTEEMKLILGKIIISKYRKNQYHNTFH